MFHKLLKSIVNDINMLYAFDALELSADDYKKFMEAIDKKIDCVKSHNYDLWCRLALTSNSYREAKKIIKAYLKDVK